MIEDFLSLTIKLKLNLKIILNVQPNEALIITTFTYVILLYVDFKVSVSVFCVTSCIYGPCCDFEKAL